VVAAQVDNRSPDTGEMMEKEKWWEEMQQIRCLSMTEKGSLVRTMKCVSDVSQQW
jgi:hypothetical protein